MTLAGNAWRLALLLLAVGCCAGCSGDKAESQQQPQRRGGVSGDRRQGRAEDDSPPDPGHRHRRGLLRRVGEGAGGRRAAPRPRQGRAGRQEGRPAVHHRFSQHRGRRRPGPGESRQGSGPGAAGARRPRARSGPRGPGPRRAGARRGAGQERHRPGAALSGPLPARPDLARAARPDPDERGRPRRHRARRPGRRAERGGDGAC